MSDVNDDSVNSDGSRLAYGFLPQVILEEIEVNVNLDIVIGIRTDGL
jgi:hypothetical protein